MPNFKLGNNFEWLSLMQHHLAITRLLDFTYSFYNAVYFILENSIADSTILAINLQEINKTLAKKFNTIFSNENVFDIYSRNTRYVNDLISDDNIERRSRYGNFILNIEPYLLHERLIVQNGFFCFLFFNSAW